MDRGVSGFERLLCRLAGHDWYPTWWQFLPGFTLPVKRWECKGCPAVAYTWVNEPYPKPLGLLHYLLGTGI